MMAYDGLISDMMIGDREVTAADGLPLQENEKRDSFLPG
jgi:hypothetical protein